MVLLRTFNTSFFLNFFVAASLLLPSKPKLKRQEIAASEIIFNFDAHVIITQRESANLC